jgi:tetratricopeptide (TPR) repeat protein
METPAANPAPTLDPVAVQRRQLKASLEAGDYDAAADLLTQMAADSPADPDLRYQLGLLLAALQPVAAIPHLVQAAELDPTHRASAMALADSIRLAELSGDPAYTLLQAGRALAAQDEWVLAGEAFRRATLVRPDFAEAWAFLGEAYQHGSQPDPVMALQALQQALALDPASLAAHTLLSLYWQRQGDDPQALAVLEEAARLHPADPFVQVELGKALGRLGELDGGLAAHQRAITQAPNDPAYPRLLAEYCLTYELSLAELALPAARQAVALAPTDPAALTTLGQVLLLLGDLDNAQRALLRALQLDPSHTSALVQLGLVYALLNDLPAARAAWEQVQQIAPGSPAATQARRLIENYFP